MPAITDETLVQVDVAIDKPWQNQVPLQVDDLGALVSVDCHSDISKAPVCYRQLQWVAAGINSIGKHAISHFSTSPVDGWPGMDKHILD
jgi:hypothetical protein